MDLKTIQEKFQAVKTVSTIQVPDTTDCKVAFALAAQKCKIIIDHKPQGGPQPNLTAGHTWYRVYYRIPEDLWFLGMTYQSSSFTLSFSFSICFSLE